MPFSTPRATVRTLVDAMNRGDLDTACACYAPDAVFAAAPGQLFHTADTRRAALDGMLAMQPALTTLSEIVLQGDDIALYQSAWRMTGIDTTGAPVALDGRSADVLHRQPDGTWRIVVDNPWGALLLDATQSDPAP